MTGERLFKSDTDSQTLSKILSDDITPPSRRAPEVSSALDGVVLRGLNREPSKRFSSAQEMALALDSAIRLATSTEVGEWVCRVAQPALTERARIVAEIERAGDTGIRLGSSAPPVAPTPSHPQDFPRDLPTARMKGPDLRALRAPTPGETPSTTRPATWVRKPASVSTKTSVALFSIDDGEYQELMRDDFVKTARGYGFPARAYRADNDSDKQVAQIRQCLREPPDQRPTVVMVAPVREIQLLSAAHEAARLGVGWVVLNGWSDYLNHLRAEFPDLPIFSIMADQKEIGRIQGRQIASLLQSRGELVYIQGPMGTSQTVRRYAGLQEILQGSSVDVFTTHSDWTREGGARAMREWGRVFHGRELPSFVVGAQNDAMAMGARDTVAEFTRERSNFSVDSVSFSGCDGSPSFGQRLVIDGKLSATVIQPVCSGRAIGEIAAMLHGGPRLPAMIELKPQPFPEPHLAARSSQRK
jgi:ABC-type sugar transport system substrate-binding protein